MLGAAEVYARNNQACIITPFILSGAMSPVTVASISYEALRHALIVFERRVRDHPSAIALAIATRFFKWR